MFNSKSKKKKVINTSPIEEINKIWNTFISNLKEECEKNDRIPNMYFRFLKLEDNVAFIKYVDVNIKIVLNNLLNKGIINTFVLNTETEKFEKMDFFICFNIKGEIINRKLKLTKEEIESKKTKKICIDRILNSKHLEHYIGELSAKKNDVFSIAYPTYKEYSELKEAPYLIEWSTGNKNEFFDISDELIEDYKKAGLVEKKKK